jgi:hypothetical protein
MELKLFTNLADTLCKMALFIGQQFQQYASDALAAFRNALLGKWQEFIK